MVNENKRFNFRSKKGSFYSKMVNENKRILDGSEEKKDVELSLGLSLNGRFGFDPNRPSNSPLFRSSSLSNFTFNGNSIENGHMFNNNGVKNGPMGDRHVVVGSSNNLMRSSSLSSDFLFNNNGPMGEHHVAVGSRNNLIRSSSLLSDNLANNNNGVKNGPMGERHVAVGSSNNFIRSSSLSSDFLFNNNGVMNGPMGERHVAMGSNEQLVRSTDFLVNNHGDKNRPTAERYLAVGSSKNLIRTSSISSDFIYNNAVNNGLIGESHVANVNLIRSSSISSNFIYSNGVNNGPMGERYVAIGRTCSLPVSMEEELRKRKEVQTARRKEAKRKRVEKMRNGRMGERHVVIGSQGSGSSGGSGNETRLTTQGLNISDQSSPEQNEQKQPIINTDKPTSTKAPNHEANVMMKNMMADMPCVSTRSVGPSGKTIEGFLYRYRKGEELRIVCVCHGSFLTPAEFVKHAGGGDVSQPLKHIVVNPSQLL